MDLPHGQGKPLPDFLKLDGEWVIENLVFLYYSDPDQSATGAAPRFTRGANRHDERPCIGFDVSQLAAAFDLPTDAVLAANRNGTLICRGTADTPPKHGGHSATTYAFRLDGKDAYLTVEMNDDKGTA
jgi:hypothetical protein